MSIIGIINKEKWELNDMKLLTTMVLVLGTLAFLLGCIFQSKIKISHGYIRLQNNTLVLSSVLFWGVYCGYLFMRKESMVTEIWNMLTSKVKVIKKTDAK